MLNEYKTVLCEYRAEFIEKKSKFIATLRHVTTQEEATAFIEEMRSEFWDATHNVYAYALVDGNVKRYSDDGEPSGTSGVPSLNVLEGEGLLDVCVVITRYFGGTLLGTGGLVRAYSKATQDVLASAEVYLMLPGTVCQLNCEYSDLTLVQKLIESCDGEIENTEYTDKITITFILKDEYCDDFKEKLRETFSARLNMEEKERILLPFLKK